MNYFQKVYSELFRLHTNLLILPSLENLMMVPGKQSGEKLTNALFNSKIVNRRRKKN